MCIYTLGECARAREPSSTDDDRRPKGDLSRENQYAGKSSLSRRRARMFSRGMCLLVVLCACAPLRYPTYIDFFSSLPPSLPPSGPHPPLLFRFGVFSRVPSSSPVFVLATRRDESRVTHARSLRVAQSDRTRLLSPRGTIVPPLVATFVLDFSGGTVPEVIESLVYDNLVGGQTSGVNRGYSPNRQVIWVTQLLTFVTRNIYIYIKID